MFNDYDYDYEMSVYDVSKELETYAKAEKKRMNKMGVINTAKAWNNDNYGSAYCATVNLSDIFAAYNDYKATKKSMGLYGDNYGEW